MTFEFLNLCRHQPLARSIIYEISLHSNIYAIILNSFFIYFSRSFRNFPDSVKPYHLNKITPTLKNQTMRNPMRLIVTVAGVNKFLQPQTGRFRLFIQKVPPSKKEFIALYYF